MIKQLRILTSILTLLISATSFAQVQTDRVAYTYQRSEEKKVEPVTFTKNSKKIITPKSNEAAQAPAIAPDNAATTESEAMVQSKVKTPRKRVSSPITTKRTLEVETKKDASSEMLSPAPAAAPAAQTPAARTHEAH